VSGRDFDQDPGQRMAAAAPKYGIERVAAADEM
jgi:hypothetical protein